MRGKACKENWRFYKKPNLGFPALILSCSFFFIAGLFASNLLLSQVLLFYIFFSFAFYLVLVIIPTQGTSSDERWLRARARQLQSVEEEIISKYDLLPSGESGDDFITLIPFQVVSINFKCSSADHHINLIFFASKSRYVVCTGFKLEAASTILSRFYNRRAVSAHN